MVLIIGLLGVYSLAQPGPVWELFGFSPFFCLPHKEYFVSEWVFKSPTIEGTSVFTQTIFFPNSDLFYSPWGGHCLLTPCAGPHPSTSGEAGITDPDSLHVQKPPRPCLGQCEPAPRRREVRVMEAGGGGHHLALVLSLQWAIQGPAGESSMGSHPGIS